MARLALMTMVIVACGTATSGPATPTTLVEPTQPAAPLVQLGMARDRWAATDLDTYRFVYQNDCGECDPSWSLPRQVVVWDNHTDHPDHPTITALFDHVEAAIREGRQVEVVYHPDLGHPTEISIDMAARVRDGGTHLLISGLVPGLPGEEASLNALEEARRLWDSGRPTAYEFRVAIACDCHLAGSIWTRVDGDRIEDWDVEFVDEPGGTITPITIDDMFDDLHQLFASSEGLVDGGIRISGAADYHPELGYPVWLGLDIEIIDPEADLADLAPRVVFSVLSLTPIDTEDLAQTELETARETWAALRLSSYQYRLTLHDIVEATFSEPYTVTVVDGVVAEVASETPITDKTEVPAHTVEELFELIQTETLNGKTVEVLFHEMGYPVLVIVVDPATDTPPSLAISIDSLTELP